MHAMHHYLDIHLRLDPEFPAHQLMAALFAKLHRVLAQHQTHAIGVSFPGYEAPGTLGRTLRLFGPAADLTALMARPWLPGVQDHVTLGGITPVPTTASHRRLQRVQAKSNPERLMRRQMRRHGLSEEEGRTAYEGAKAQLLPLPFVVMASASTGQTFKLFLKLGPPEAQSQPGMFNAYGLSPTATVPWF
jgi:CRISPR-associated endonuclease Csy4